MVGDMQPDNISLTYPLAGQDVPDAVAAALGDQSVLCRLRNAASAMLRAWHRNVTPRQRLAEAEEIVQEAARRALARRSAYDPERSIVPWLAGFVTMVCKERTRSRATDAAMGQADLALENLAVSLSRSALDILDDRLDTMQILERLPPDDQYLLRLRFFEDATALEIGRLLGISAAAVRVRLFRVLERLRNEMAPEREERS
jgi:RNA polymerase sigma-70 factor, ECF subfamily